jgi:hypothetical protein
LLDIEFQIMSEQRPIALAGNAMSVLRCPLNDAPGRQVADGRPNDFLWVGNSVLIAKFWVNVET